MSKTRTTPAERAARRADRARRDGKAPEPDAAAPAGAAAKPKAGWRETVRFWVVALVVIYLVRAFLFEPFRIPSESMEETLLVGDFLVVSKLHYGPRTPNTIGLPLSGWFIPGLVAPQTRLPGFSEVRRSDVVVFNYPAPVDVVRGAIPATIPPERRDPYIKRIVGLPGDTVAVVDKTLLINGRRTPLARTMEQRWRVTAAGVQRPLAPELDELGVSLLGDVRDQGQLTMPRQFDIVATPGAARRLAARPDVGIVEPWFMPRGVRVGSLSFPAGSNSNADQFGPIVVPAAGRPMALDSASWPMLQDVITRHEGHQARALPDGSIEVDGRVATTYTPAQDYYFVMGDSRDNSVDGRYWGFVPRNHLVGKATFILMSFDRTKPLLGFIPRPRLGRFFREVP